MMSLLDDTAGTRINLEKFWGKSNAFRNLRFLESQKKELMNDDKKKKKGVKKLESRMDNEP